MTTRAAPRPTWAELPEALRAGVARILDSPVVASESRQGGWSPGSADLVTTADRHRAFVKTADAAVNERTVAMHRREASVLGLLGDGPAPRLLGTVETGSWFGLVVEAVDARHPLAASDADTIAVLGAVAALPDAPAGSGLDRFEDDLREEALGWRILRAAGVDVGADLERLDGLAAGLREALHGDSVVHGDLRIDNALIDGEGRGRLVDWPSAVVGARWLDAITYLLDVRHVGGSVAAGMRHPVLRDVPSEHIDTWLSVLGAYFLATARTPEPSSLPGIRAYQRAQGETALGWLLERRPDLR